MQHAKVEDGWVKLTGPVSASAIRDLQRFGDIAKLSIVCPDSPFTVVMAYALGALKSVETFWLWCDVTALKSVETFWLWCDVTRPAMQHVVRIPGLRVLDVLHIRHPGYLAPFEEAATLEEFRCNTGLTERDLLAVCACHSLREIGAQSSVLSPAVIEAFLRLPALRSLDLEATNFDDALATHLSQSKSLRSLDIGGTKITRQGLQAICGMTQLTSLDLWAMQISENDLDLLARLPHLEYVSLGNYDGAASLDADVILPKLLTLPSLRRIWLDGIALRPDQKAALEARYATVRLT